MSTSQTVPADAPPARTAAPPDPARLFYTAAAAILLVLTFAGFSRFYVEGRAYPGRELAPPIRTLVIAHGAGMTAWMVVILVQPLLIAVRKHRVHMTLGWITTALAAVVVVLGWQTGVASAQVTPPEARIWGLPPRQFMIVPLASIVIFAGLVTAGVLLRKRPRAHRPLMFLATLSTVSAAISRIDALDSLYLGTMWESLFGPFFMTLVIGAALLAVKCVLTKSLDRWFAGGLAGLVVASAIIWQSATSQAWDAIAEFLLG